MPTLGMLMVSFAHVIVSVSTCLADCSYKDASFHPTIYNYAWTNKNGSPQKDILKKVAA